MDNCFVSLLMQLQSITAAEFFVFIILETNSASLAYGSELRKYSQISDDTEPVLFPPKIYTSDQTYDFFLYKKKYFPRCFQGAAVSLK